MIKRWLMLLLAGSMGGSALAQDCSAAEGMESLCGPINAEDLVWLGDSGLLLASGMADATGKGRLYVIDPQQRSFDEIYPRDGAVDRLDAAQFPDCPGAPQPAGFSTHGLAIQDQGDGKHRVYATAHGERESVEVFEVGLSGGQPQVVWIGCVPIPEGNSINSVAPLPDGGFLTTRISGTDEADTSAIFEGRDSGFLYEWHPGGALGAVPETSMSGPNGIDVSPDGRHVYVASWGRGEVTRFVRDAEGGLSRESTVSAGFRVDNLRFTQDGMILLAGHRLAETQDCGQPLCFTEWEVAELDPATSAVTTLAVHEPTPEFLGATVAVRSDQGLWLGTFHGTEVIFIPEP